MKNIIKKEVGEIREILGKIKRKNLGGNTGQAIKNSSWQLSATLVAKMGSLLFTIIIARLMLPELYGLYGLALSTILILGIFGDMGMGTALNTFLSKNIDKSPGKAKGYFQQLTKWKSMLMIFSITLIILLSKWLATSYYQKPIYYALIAGIIYFPMVVLQSYLTTFFTSTNNFRQLLVKEVILQVSRLVLLPLVIMSLLSKITSQEIYLFWVFVSLSVCYLLSAIYMLLKIRKNQPFKNSKAISLSIEEKKDLKRFLIPLSVMALSGLFFGYVDQIMLGHYVESVFLGFYQASFNLATSAAAIVAFSSIAMFPILARLKGERLERGFVKARNATALVSILAAIFTFLLAPLIIKIVYGATYLTSVTYLKILSILILSFPLISLYITYYTSQERVKTIAMLLIPSTILNVILNYIFINIGLQLSMSYAVMGACLATIVSRAGYLGGLIAFRKWKRK